ncbi:hypothetical protein RAA17_22070 [Komagataeibacter rhaeticus]|nr:hypothetical protein [Komagataeibacter rhaeticus]
MVMCESGMEVKVFTWLERSEEVSWYQEQPVAFPYTMEGQEKLYYPDAVVRDREGRILVIEVKPIFNMFRQQTVEKGLAAIKHLQPRGIGYLLVDSSGHTLSDLAGHPYDRAVAEKLEALFSQGLYPSGSPETFYRSHRASLISLPLSQWWSIGTGPSPICRSPSPVCPSVRPFVHYSGLAEPPVGEHPFSPPVCAITCQRVLSASVPD